MAEIETLTTVWDARFDKLEQKLNNVIRANFAAAAKIEAAWGNANDNMERSFSRSGAGLREFGSASLAAGAGAAAGAAAVGALVSAFAGARAAVKFAADLKDTAAKVHLTTDALQEYQYALGKAGGKADEADEALNAFSETLGKAQAGVKGSLKPFQELGFTKEQVKSFTDADAALKAVVERIQGLPNQQKDAVIQQLGLEKLAPLISDGVDEMERLRAAAHEAGVVMDADLIKRGAELNEKFETVSKVIDIQLKSALVDLAPILVGLLQLVADLARAAADVADNFRSVQNKTTQGLRSQLEDLKQQRETGRVKVNAVDRLVGAIPLAGPALEAGRLAQRGSKSRAQLDKEISDIEAVLAKRAAETAASVTPTRTLVEPPGRTTKAPTDRTAQAAERVEQAELAVERQLLSAWSELIVGVDQRAQIAKLILDVEKEEYQSRVDKQIADIKAAKNIDAAAKSGLIARLEATKLEQEKVDQLKRELIDRELVEQKARDALSVRQSEFDVQEDALRISESLARTAAERRDLELKLLDLSDQRLKAELEAVLASKATTEADKQIARNKLAALDATRPDREEQTRRNTMGPWESFLDRLPQTAGKVNEAFETLYADGVTTLIDGLAEAGAGMRSFKSVIVQTIQQMAVEANRVLLKNLFSGLASGAGGLFGGFNLGSFLSSGGFNAGGIDISGLAGLYASGTNSARGGLSLVGERGPELLNIPRGAQVIPNDILRTMAKSRATSINNSRTSSTVFNVSVTGGGTAAQNRETGAQIAAEASRRMAMYRRRGY